MAQDSGLQTENGGTYHHAMFRHPMWSSTLEHECSDLQKRAHTNAHSTTDQSHAPHTKTHSDNRITTKRCKNTNITAHQYRVMQRHDVHTDTHTHPHKHTTAHSARKSLNITEQKTPIHGLAEDTQTQMHSPKIPLLQAQLQ